MNSFRLTSISSLTKWSLIFILIIFFCLVGWIIVQQRRKKLQENKRWVEQFPSIVSTLGVLGTFIGITIGLLHFDSNNIEASIPSLLDGLKTAFFTSLAGMFGSLILSWLVSHVFDKEEKGVSDITDAARQIVNSVQTMNSAITPSLAAIVQHTQNSGNDMTILKQTISEIKEKTDKLSEIYDAAFVTSNKLTNIESVVNNILPNIDGATRVTSNTLDSIENKTIELLTINTGMAASLVAINENDSNIARNVGQSVDIVESMATAQNEIVEGVNRFGDRLHSEVVEIEDKMGDTNRLLTQKFEEFSDLLRRSNTEALVEVMRKVTEEFQRQMNDLISRLVQENFEQLNNSVERLNTWQQDNKEMIHSLTKQYKEMSVNFENTSTSLTRVKEDTTALVSEGGKLEQLVHSLSKVIIEDEKFIQITSNLTETASLTKSNMEQFDESTRKLNEWVRKQRDFVEGVRQLMLKLEEISKIKDYNEKFWSGTKRSLEEGVGIIKEGSKALNEQLTSLDQQFYARLAATLAELDACIQAMINKNK